MAMSNPITGRKVRVGVLGAGRWANIAHLPGWTRDPRCEVVAVCDADRRLAEETAPKFGHQFGAQRSLAIGLLPRVLLDARQNFVIVGDVYCAAKNP